MTLEKRIFYHHYLYIFKCKHGYVSHHLSLTERKEIHDHNPRNKSMVRFLLVKTNWGKQSLGYQAVKDWNDLNMKIKLSNSILSFGNNFFRYI